MTQLAHYDAACRAIALAMTTDEVSAIRNQAEAMRAYAKQAKNRQLEIDAAEIRIRAERRLGELIAAQRRTVGLAKGGRPPETGSVADPVKTVPTLADAGIDKHLAQRARKLAAVPEPVFAARLANWREQAAHEDARVTPSLAVHFSSETGEHYTPQSVLEVVHAVFGDIPDLDPCSNSRATPNVVARSHYTIEDDGLSQPWGGRVFLNPPYGREIVDWINKLRNEWRRGEILEAIALLPNRPDTEWFDALTGSCDDAVFCSLHGRLTFVGNTNPAPFPSLVAYFGLNHDRFASVFWERGLLWVRPPRDFFVDQG